MTDTTNLAPQRFAGLPQFNTPLVDPRSGVVSQAWQWFFTAMWQKNGSTFSVVPTAAFPKQQPGLPITMHDAQTGDELGQLITGTSIVMPPAEFTVVETVDADGNPNFAITWNNQSANEVFAGPASGPAAVPTFRFLVSGDLPIATTSAVGAVKPDGTSITIDPDGTIHGSAGGAIPLTSSHIFVGNVSNVATDVPMSGDATIATSGALTLANTAVTPASYGDATHIPSFTVDSKGRITSASVNAIVIPSGANPSAIASDVAVNGVATTFMRSDAAPAVQKTSAAQFGLCKPDNSTIVASGGVLSAGGVAVLGFSPFFPSTPFTKPVAANFTLNKSTNASTSTLADMASGRGIVLAVNGGTNATATAEQATLSSSAFTLNAFLYNAGNLNGLWGTMICIKDNTGKYVMYGWRNSAAGFGAFVKFTYTALNGTIASTIQFGLFNQNNPLWLRVQCTGGNFIFSASFDGENYQVILTESQTSFLGATLSTVGIAHINNTSPATLFNFVDLFSWTNTSP